MIFAGTFMDVFLGGSMNNRNQYQIIIFAHFRVLILSLLAMAGGVLYLRRFNKSGPLSPSLSVLCSLSKKRMDGLANAGGG